MYIRSVKLKNIRCFPELEWSLEDRPTRAGWHVILGDNGTGKSTFLRAISIAILGVDAAMALIDLMSYVRNNSRTGSMSVVVERQPAFDIFSSPTDYDFEDLYIADIEFNRRDIEVAISSNATRPAKKRWRIARPYGTSGWFSAGYGSLRRMTGGDLEFDRRIASNTDAARHFTLLVDSAALTESIRWLQSLQFAKLENDFDVVSIDDIKNLINQPDFLPNNVRLVKATNRSVEFIDTDGVIVAIEDLGEGYRSVLAMTFDLIRQLSVAYRNHQLFTEGKNKAITIDFPGVVLIDEIDVHLHPTWQRQIGPWFRKYFPNIQFIVTTHSHLVCQAAIDGGSIFQLPSPGSEETGHFLQGIELDRLLYGDILDAYSTEAFGAGITRSEEAQHLYERLATLNVKSLTSTLSAKERKERQHLQGIFASSLGFSIPSMENGAGH